MHVTARRFSSSIRSAIDTIGVVGGGQMGMGIAITGALRANKKMIVMDSNSAALDKSMSFAQKWLNGQAAKSKLTQDEADKAMANISGTNEMDKMSTVDFVIEAVTENESVKQSIFESLDKACADDVILASNTSSIPI